MSTPRQLVSQLQRFGPASRADLARGLGLSKPSTSVAIEALLQRGVLEELGPGRSSLGRPPTLLRLNARHRLVLGVELDVGSFQMALGDLQGEPLAAEERPYDPAAPEEALRACAQDLLTHHAPSGQVQCVAVGLPGVIEGDQLRYAPKLPQLEQPGALARLRGAFDRTTLLFNDVNLAAVGEARGDEVLAFLWIGSGLGVGLAEGRRVRAGHKGRAGEIGYLPLPDGQPLEKLLSADGLAQTLGLAPAQLPAALHGEDPALLRSPGAAPFLDALLFALQVLTVTLDPARIVVGGRVGVKLGAHLAPLRARLLEHLPFAPELNLSARPRQPVTVGALKVAAHSAFRDLLRELDPKVALSAAR